MPQHALPFQPHAVQIVLWHLQEAREEGQKWDVHFPQRQVDAMSCPRQEEHRAVAFAVTELLGHAQWHLTHDGDGKPQLHLFSEAQYQALSVSHIEMDGEVWAAVARWDDGRSTGGVDLVLMDDLRIQRVAPRVMSTHEQILWKGKEAWAWATKEAMFKGHGPDLEFQSQALLTQAMNAHQGPSGTVRGEVRGEPWAGAWGLVRQRLLLVWGS